MGITLLVHILAGGLALAAGYLSLFAAKGRGVHRRAGMVFVLAMTVMGLSAAVLSAARGAEATALGGLLAAYLVITALTTVRRSTPAMRRLGVGLMLLGFGLGVALLEVALRTRASPGGVMDGVPAPPLFMNAAVALLASASDLRVVRSGGPRGAPMLARHLWRMCFALFLAAASFFLGQADELPRALRILPLLALPVLVPLAAMAYWLVRLRVRRRTGGSPRPASATTSSDTKLQVT